MTGIEVLLDPTEYDWIKREAQRGLRGAYGEATLRLYLGQAIERCYREMNSYSALHGKPFPIMPATFERLAATLDWPESTFVRIMVPAIGEVASLVERRRRQLEAVLNEDIPLTERNVVNWDLRRWLATHGTERGWRSHRPGARSKAGTANRPGATAVSDA